MAAASAPLRGTHVTLPTGRTYWRTGAGTRLVVGVGATNATAQSANDAFWVTSSPATSGWQAHAEAGDYVLALLENLPGQSWNVGGGWPSGAQDDAGYALQVVAHAATAVGPFTEVFVGGFSAGGAMASRLLVDHPEVFAAGGSAAGWMPSYPTRPVDLRHYHGTGDTTVPVRGGFNTAFGFTFPAAFLEAERAPRGSRVVLYPHSGGHGVPGWAADDLWQWWTAGRHLP